jgi:tetratricopeptide (TPR) repeat protein
MFGTRSLGMKALPFLIACMATSLVTLAPARADNTDDCASGVPALAISGCTYLIETGQIGGAPISKRNLAAAYNNRGQAFLERRDFDRALRDHAEAIRLDPTSDIAFSGRGNAYASKGEYQLSIEDHDEAVRLAPQNPAAYYNRGVVHFLYRSYADSVLDFKRAVILDPDNPSMRQALADTFYFTGDVPRAVEEWSEACALVDANLAQVWQSRLAELGHFNGDIDGRCDARVVEAFETCARAGCFF